jgi:predicted metal-binding protein
MDECSLCPDCPGRRLACKNPAQARPSAEALGVDVFGTVRKLGYPIDVLTDTTQEMNRYAFLLVS